jgi:hypothetical protein
MEGVPANLGISMTSANVKILFHRGVGDRLAADIDATFELIDHSDLGKEESEFLVAFPVSGLRSSVLTVSQFSVLVDDQHPATVLRQAIVISRRNVQLKDTPVYGQLDAKFAPAGGWGVPLSNGRLYTAAYVWPQKTKRGKTTRVHVTYSVSLLPQSVHYFKSYKESPDDGEVVPFDDIQVGNWDAKYYFLDYVLLSGATWDGPIGRETIEFSSDPDFNLDCRFLEPSYRSPIGYESRQSAKYDGMSFSWGSEKGKWTLILEGKPNGDLLITIPASIIPAPKPVPDKASSPQAK